MRVTPNYNPQAQQRQQTNGNSAGFAEALASQMKAANQTGASSSAAALHEKRIAFAQDPAISAAMRENRAPAENYPATLTQEQIDDIHSRYDINNMQWMTHESAALGEELFELGVINDDERKFFYGLAKFTKDKLTPGVLIAENEAVTSSRIYEHKQGETMLDMLLGELAAQREKLDFLKANEIDTTNQEEYLAQFEKAYKILRQFM